jgi:hypothetical protein
LAVVVLAAAARVLITEIYKEAARRLQHPHTLPSHRDQGVDELGGCGLGAQLAGVMAAVVGVGPQREVRGAGDDQVHRIVG